jgi:trimethylamine--corrinoid protein Co-methyltransferase
LSDSKAIDAQAGIETGMGAALAAVTGIDQVSGPGMLDFGACFSVAKLVLDDEICGMAARLRAGIGQPADPPIAVIEELLRDGHLLIAMSTRRQLRHEVFFTGGAIDRSNRPRWMQEGQQTLDRRVGGEIAALLRRYQAPALPAEVRRALTERMSHAARANGLPQLPSTPCEQ